MAGAALKSLDQTWRVSEKDGEARLQQQIITVARLRGWRLVYHTHDSRRSQPGFPDLVMLREGRGFAIEVKIERGIVRPSQQLWIDGFDGAVFESTIARPSNFVELERRLR